MRSSHPSCSETISAAGKGSRSTSTRTHHERFGRRSGYGHATSGPDYPADGPGDLSQDRFPSRRANAEAMTAEATVSTQISDLHVAQAESLPAPQRLRDE